MAMPIKDTPILEGKDAKRFQRIIAENENRSVPRQEYDRAMAILKQVETKEKESF